jgi:hypothetical protein
MLKTTRICDICGREVGVNDPRYSLTYRVAFISKEKDICPSCLNKLKEQFSKPKTEPQAEVIACPIIDDDARIYTTEPQKCETCKHYDAEVESIACERCLDGKYSRYEPKTDCSWK